MILEIDSETPPTPGVKRWLISCDESGVDGAPYYGFGTLWMPWQRRGDFQRLIADVRERHRYFYEIKWTRVQERYLPFYRDLITLFFQTGWLVFHCIIIRAALVDRSFHDGSIDLARRKHFTMLLTNKIKRSIKAFPGREQTFRIWVDPIASSYAKADEACEIIANSVLAKVFGSVRPVDKVLTRNSKDTPSIQLCDLIIGAIVGEWRDNSTTGAKRDLRKHIASFLGWENLLADTPWRERKFNIWYFHDPALTPDREVVTRAVKLLIPIPR